MTTIKPGSTVVFFGDSITDAGHGDDPDRLGQGYVRLLAGELSDSTVINAGVGGNRIVDLQRRLEDDVLAHQPAVVSIMIGINDTWRRFDSDDPTTTAAYETGYRNILTRIDAAGASAVLLEPFVLPVTDEQATGWREDLQPRIEAVHRLAAEFDAPVVELDVELNRLAVELGQAELGSPELGRAALAADGVHPTERGHAEIARLWLAAVRA